ncbi:MAG: uroporphyrinogen-III synthase [Sneathiella sp.]|uniref:uroporphyrinogen-III synthase n=1 Tax=Sneathiella sp. TaxID=1964365 RepID=UPI003001876A
MKILVTRPEPDASRLAATLSDLGHEVVLAPMMVIENLPGTKIATEDVQALLVTSANGARALGRATAFRNVKVFAVGNASAEAVRGEGFDNVVSAAGDVPSLAKQVISDCKPKNGKLVHIAGTDVAGDLSGLLKVAGFECDRAVLYETKVTEKLDTDLFSMFNSGALDAALFYSPRTALIFKANIKAAGLEAALDHVIAFCLSDAVAEKINDFSWSDVKIAKEPNQDSLLMLLEDVNLANLKTDNPDKIREQKVSDKKSGKPDTPQKTTAAAEDPSLKKILETDVKGSAGSDAQASKALPETKKKSSLSIVLLLLIFVFSLGLAAWPLLYPKVQIYLPTQTAEIISGQFGRADSLDATGELANIQASLKTDYAKLSNRIDALEKAKPVATSSVTTSTTPETSNAVASLSASTDQRIGGLQAQLEEQVQKIEMATNRLAKQESEISGLKVAEPTAQTENPETQSEILDLKNELLDLKTRMNALQSELATEQDSSKTQAMLLSSIESSLKDEADNKASVQAENKRTLMLLALGQLQRETRNNEPFENGLAQVSAVATSDLKTELDLLSVIAPKGAVTMPTLQKEFANIASDISQSARLPSDETWYGQTLHRIASAVKFRRVDDLDGTNVDAIVARTEQDLLTNDLDKAVAEVEKLTGPSAEIAQDWLAKAKARLNVENAISGLLEKVTSEAISTPSSN